MRVSHPGFRIPTVAAACLLGAALVAIIPSSTQTAIANGDTRVINLHHAHTQESISVAFRVNGSYDAAALKKLNWFLRDWRNDATTKMDPRLFDVIWEAQRGAGSSAPVRVQSAYRSPATNSMLRRRSRGVAEFSQHMQGRAMDIHVSDVSMARIRETAMRLQRGGVGYYPDSNFVHLDVGSVRAWPRMSYDQLARLFPNGKTVHLPTNGQPLARYEEARIELASRGDSSAPSLEQVKSKGFFASLFGFGEDDDEGAKPVTRTRGRAAPVQMAAYAPAASEDGSAAAFFRSDASRSPVIAEAARRAVTAPRPVMPPVVVPVTPPIAAPASVSPVLTASLAPVRPGSNAPLPPRRPDAPAAVSVAPVLVVAASAPLPPTRPNELMVSYADTTASISKATSISLASIPMPPVRHTNLASAGLPPLITDGRNNADGQAPGVMAYAAASSELTALPRATRTSRTATPAQTSAARALQARKIALTPARLDRSNFASLTNAQSIASALPDSPAAASGLRSAARAEASYLMFAPAIATPMTSPMTTGRLEPRS